MYLTTVSEINDWHEQATELLYSSRVLFIWIRSMSISTLYYLYDGCYAENSAQEVKDKENKDINSSTESTNDSIIREQISTLLD